ncbi:hypothetical protein LCGC14_0535560 [marine sediment metagenome]|uniref:DUF5659 domain-containing protein n=1 Tax=marine sediment metagenome TaxID=412755 RepID=A0A0F9SCQ9_9ZZZZ
MNNEDTLQISDLPLATFLYAKGIILQDIIDSPDDARRKVFVFSKPPEELLAAFQSGNAHINVLAFNNAQNTLKGLVNRR